MKTEQFEIETGDRRTRLTGQLDFPDSSAERGAVVLMVPGGWFMDRDGYMGGSGTDRDMIYRDLASGILEAGIAVLRFDNRGVGCNEMTMPPCRDGSDELVATRHYLDACVDTSVRQTVNVQTQMDDVEKVWEFALNHCDLNPARAFIWAHSEGGLNVARLIGSKRIDPRGVSFVGTITESPASVFQWQTVDRYAQHIMSWDEDGDGRVTETDIQRHFAHDEFLAAVGMAPEAVAAPKEGWTKETIRQRFVIEYERIKAEAVAEPDDAPYPRQGDGDEVHVVVASNNWWKQWFEDWTPVIDRKWTPFTGPKRGLYKV